MPFPVGVTKSALPFGTRTLAFPSCSICLGGVSGNPPRCQRGRKEPHGHRVRFRHPYLRERGQYQKRYNMLPEAQFVHRKASCERPRVAYSSGVEPLCDRLSLRRSAGGRALVVLASSQAVGLTVVRGRSEPRGSTNRPSRPSFVLSRTRKGVLRVRWVQDYASGVTRRGGFTLVTTERSHGFKSFDLKGLSWVDQAATGTISGDAAEG